MAIQDCINSIDDSGRELVEHGSLQLPIGCYYDNLGKMSVDWHWHEELEFAVVTEGSAAMTVGNEKYILNAGEGFFINSGILHEMQDMEASGCRFHSIVFHSRLVGGDSDSVFFNDYILPVISSSAECIVFRQSEKWHRRAMELIERAWQLCLDEEKGFEIYVRNCLSELILIVSEHLSDELTADKNVAKKSERIKTMLQFIHNNFHSEISVQSIADSASVSKSECLRCFKNAINTTPIDYLKKHRIRRACALLLNTADSITDIGMKCGFNESSYFIKVFRIEKGCTPSEYRKANCSI